MARHGYKQTPQHIANRVATRVGKPLSAEQREKLVIAGRARFADVWTDEIVFKVRALLDARVSRAEIARQIGRKYTTVNSWIKARGWKAAPKPAATPQEKDQKHAARLAVKALYRERMRERRIAVAKAQETAEFRARFEPKPAPAPLPATADVNEWLRTNTVTRCPAAYADVSSARISDADRAALAARPALEQTSKRQRHYQSCVRGAARSAARHG